MKTYILKPNMTFTKLNPTIPSLKSDPRITLYPKRRFLKFDGVVCDRLMTASSA